MEENKVVSEEDDLWEFSLTSEDLETIDSICQEASRPSTDNLRRLPESLFGSLKPCRKNRYTPYDSPDRIRYPEIRFKGNIIYCRTPPEADNAAHQILSSLKTNIHTQDKPVLGFDIEWKPTFRAGVAPGKAAVMQICGSNTHCYVIHIFHSGITKKLKTLLEDPDVVKVGVCIANDAYKVLQDYNISVKSVEDLSDLANRKVGGPPRKWSLARLTETLVCKQLPKPSKIRLGNWEAKFLSKEQSQYAAADAFVSWYLYQVLQSLPEPVNGNTEETAQDHKADICL